MAIIHEATLTPGKRDLMVAWLPEQPWFTGGREAAETARPVAAYRFDDPAGEVGVEGFLLAASDADGRRRTWHVPLTYRAAPLDDAEEHLVGTTEHSVLGTRWVYDGEHDPVATTALLLAALTGARGVDLDRHRADGSREQVATSAQVHGSGTDRDTAAAEALALTIVRLVGDHPPTDGARALLRGSWHDADGERQVDDAVLVLVQTTGGAR